MMGIALLAWEQVPVHVWHLVAQKLVVHLAWLYDGMDGLGHGVDFIHEGMTLFRCEIKQFRHMPAGGDDAVALVVLPGAKEGDGLVKLPDEFLGMIELGVLDLLAQNARWLGWHDLHP